jgi:hypothetical protein
LQLLNISEILKSCGSFFVGNQVAPGDDESGNAAEYSFETIGPRIVELHAVNVGYDIDAQGWHADLEDSIFSTQVIDG